MNSLDDERSSRLAVFSLAQRPNLFDFWIAGAGNQAIPMLSARHPRQNHRSLPRLGGNFHVAPHFAGAGVHVRETMP